MDEIAVTLKVPTGTATLLENASLQQRQDLIALIDAFFQIPEPHKVEQLAQDLLQAREALAGEARNNGLTPEILDTLLSDS